jgi:hypothetical protein
MDGILNAAEKDKNQDLLDPSVNSVENFARSVKVCFP